MLGSGSSPLLLLLDHHRHYLCFVCIIFASLVGMAQAQSQTQPTTDPSEVRALNSIFQQWKISNRSVSDQGWNISGEPCSGSALDLSLTVNDTKYNPFIKCNCTYNDGATCHITALKVVSLDVYGSIPDGLWTLTYLTYLNLGDNILTGSLPASIGNLTRMEYMNLGQNRLTGTLPASIGNLTRMEYMDFQNNSLSGRLPKELGSLTELRSFLIQINNFQGHLPPELGNLTKLEKLLFASSGFSGEIPSTFANLLNLDSMSASDNELTGKIPDFIGNWSKLRRLGFAGNAFEGPIPSTLTNLNSLRILSISDISKGSSSLGLIKNMKSLEVLSLRNDNISDSLPANIGEYQNLRYLDLSFNNISGQIPDSLFSLPYLSDLFLGSNMLNGTLPAQKRESLLKIDLSYNYLVGPIPSWANESKQLNLVANNFKSDDVLSSGLPSYLYCLQRNFPCKQDSPQNSTFAINCGGSEVSYDGVVYEGDNENLRPPTYYVAKTRRWGVSNVDISGYSPRSFDPDYADPPQDRLFGTARVSDSSLRYYGLGLENGNYNVSLMFLEVDSTRRSLEKRVFDVCVQGVCLKDFNLPNEAQAVFKNFSAQVSKNYLEIHLFWAGKGFCCPTFGPLISAISVTPNFKPKDGTRVARPIVGIIVGVGTVILLLLFVVIHVVQRRKRQRKHEDDDLLELVSRPYTFSYAELKTATNDFNPANKLGEGGFGPVYQGKLNDGRVIAVKQLSVTSHQGKNQFVAEIATISAVQQRNLVKLYGCCIEGSHRLLVYEYLENKSLDQALFRKTDVNLDWPTRFNICLGVARGLAYLHEESRPRIVHRDVKASNILLDSDFVPKISDFGLAKLYDDAKTHISTRVAGTIGYLAPEYALRGRLTEKADVFAFGVVALELVCGRPNVDTSFEEEQLYLLEWAWHLYEDNREAEMVDSSLGDFDAEEVRRVIRIAFLCTQNSPALRPSMSRVIAMLSGDVEIASITTKPGYFTDWKNEVLSSFITSTATDRSNDKSSTSIEAYAGQSPVSPTTPILHEITGNKRSCP